MICSQRRNILLLIENSFINRASDFKKLLCYWVNPRYSRIQSVQVYPSRALLGCVARSPRHIFWYYVHLSLCMWQVACFLMGPVFQGGEGMTGWAPWDVLFLPCLSPYHWDPGWGRGFHLSSISCPWLSWRQWGPFLSIRYVQFHHTHVPTVHAHCHAGLRKHTSKPQPALGYTGSRVLQFRALSPCMAASGSKMHRVPRIPLLSWCQVLLFFFNWSTWDWVGPCVFSDEEAYFIDPNNPPTSYLPLPQPALRWALLCGYPSPTRRVLWGRLPPAVGPDVPAPPWLSDVLVPVIKKTWKRANSHEAFLPTPGLHLLL